MQFNNSSAMHCLDFLSDLYIVSHFVHSLNSFTAKISTVANCTGYTHYARVSLLFYANLMSNLRSNSIIFVHLKFNVFLKNLAAFFKELSHIDRVFY